MRHMDGLEIMYPFEPSTDGAVDSVRAEAFAAVTAEAWPRMQGNLERAEELSKGIDREKRPGLRMRAAGWGTVGGATLVLGETLSRFEMSMSEYLWTGFQLLRAAGYVDDVWAVPDPPPAPAPNRDLARRHGPLLGDIRAAAADSAHASLGSVYWAGWAIGVRHRKVASSPAIQDIVQLVDSLSPAEP